MRISDEDIIWGLKTANAISDWSKILFLQNLIFCMKYHQFILHNTKVLSFWKLSRAATRALVCCMWSACCISLDKWFIQDFNKTLYYKYYLLVSQPGQISGNNMSSQISKSLSSASLIIITEKVNKQVYFIQNFEC